MNGRVANFYPGYRMVRVYCGLHQKKHAPALENSISKQFKRNINQTSTAVDLNLKDIAIYCNEERWQEWRTPIKVDAKFIDTHYNAPVSKQRAIPTILGIHDTPGSHKDLLPILEPFAMEGHRIVILNMPGNGYSEVKGKKEKLFFTHSTEERTEFLIKFLSDLDILRVDLAVGHGSGVGPLTMLMASVNIFRSALFLCPMPGLQFPESFGKMKHVHTMLKLYDRPIFKLPLSLIMKEICRRNHISASVYNAEYIIRTIFEYGYDYIAGQATSTSYKKTPLTYVMASEDRQHKPEESYKYAQIFGIQRNRFTVYDEENSPNIELLETKPRGYLKCGVELRSSDHSPQFNDYFRNVIVSELTRLLREVR